MAGVQDLDPSRLTQSEILGVTAPAATVVQLYAGRLQGSATPLRDALDVWHQVTGLEEDPVVLAEELVRADSLSLDVQRAVAVLILSTADATRLQNRAVDSLTDAEVAFLFNSLLSTRPGEEPGSEERDAAAVSLARVDRLAGLVDMSNIEDGARLVAAAIAQVAPILDVAASEYFRGSASFAPIVADLMEFYHANPPIRISEGDDFDRLSLVVDYAQLIARAGQSSLSRSVETHEGERHVRLSDAIVALAQEIQVPLDSSLALGELGSANALPEGLQAALSRIVRAQTKVVHAVNTDLAPGPNQDSQVVREVLHYLDTLRDTYPTLATYQYLYQFGAPGLSTDSSRQVMTLASLQPFLQILAQPATPLADVVSILAYVQGETVPRPLLEGDYGPGSLGRGIAELLAFEGQPLTSENWGALENETALLPAQLETAAARIIWAQLGAVRDREAILEALPDEQRAWFLGGPSPLEDAMADEWITPGEYGGVRVYFETLHQFRKTLFLSGSAIGAAIDAARVDLSPYVQPADGATQPSSSKPNGPNSSSPSPSGFGDSSEADAPAAPGFSMTTAAAPIAVSCSPNLPTANCPADIIFLGPPGTVVITGSSGGTYNAGVVGATRDHRLWIDLGGDDAYFTAAAAATLPAILQQGQSVSVMLELGGNDQYLTPPSDFGKPKQAAAEGLGTIAMLVDDDGSDLYRSDGGIGQAAARGMSLAILLDNAGNDERIVSGFDAFGQAFSGVPTPFVTQAPLGGISLLLDRELGGSIGADSYRVSSSRALAGQAVASAKNPGNSPQIAGLGGAAFLVDGAGPDTYQGGGQSAVSDSGLPLFGTLSGIAVLADLDGDDLYSRKTFDGSRLMQNGDCQTSAQVNAAAFENGLPFVDEADPTQLPDGFPLQEAGLAGQLLAVFIDLLDGGLCDGSTLVPSEVLPPGTEPDDLAQFIEEMLRKIQDGGLTTDSDSDLWPDLLERLTTNDPHSSADSPTALPPRPAAWPDNQQYPPLLPDGRRFPNATGFLVNLPGVFALGDAITTTYAREYQFSIDLGGADLYRNRVASDLQSTHLDLGRDSDRYEAGENAQAHRGILLEMGGSDMYIAGRGSQASAPRSQVSNADRSTDVAILADLGGDDLYVAGPDSQGFAERHCDPCATPVLNPQRIALLMDLVGNDTYMTPNQGVAVNRPFSSPPVDSTPLFLVGAIVDWQGVDAYRVDQQGRSLPAPVNSGISTSGLNVIVSHFADLEGRDDYREFGSNTDRSWLQNDRHDASARYGRGGIGGDTLAASLRVDVDPSLRVNGSFQSGPVDNSDDFELRLSGMRVAIGKSSATTYHEPYAVSVDLGGNDFYFNNAGATSFPSAWIYPVQQSNPPPSLGSSWHEASFSGTSNVRTLAGLAYDVAGDDTYDASEWLETESNLPNRNPDSFDPQEALASAPSAPWAARQPGFGRHESKARLLSQGTGFLGAGLLVDADGDDTYRAFRYAQGTGVVGIGVLWDRAGNDEYDYDGAVVAAPAADDGRLVWSDRRAGRWEILLAAPDSGTPARLTPPPDPNLGWAGDHVSPTLSGDVVVWSSNYGDDWDLYRLDLKSSNLELAVGGFGNQTSPTLHGGSLAFISDANGLPALYLVENVDQPVSFLVPVLVNPSAHPQQQADVFHDGEDFRVAWVELPPSGGAEVWWKNVGAGLAAERIPGDEYRWNPKISGPHLAWQQRNQSTDSWDVYYTNLDDPNAEIVIVAAGPGNQHSPDVVPGGVAYVDDASNQLRMWYHGGKGPCPVLRESVHGFASTSFDPVMPSNVYAIRRGPAPTGIGTVYDILRNSVAFCDDASTVRDSQSDEAGPLFLQGAGLQRGLGALVDEAGDDFYSAWDFSQGATFTNSVVSPNGPESIAFSAEQGAPEPLQVGNRQGDLGEQDNRGLLLDIDGSDQYESRNFTQGAHGSAVLVHQLGPVDNPAAPNPPPPVPYIGQIFAAEQAGILYDLRGRDSYRADQFAQGYAGLTIGSMIVAQPPFQPGSAPPQPRPDLSPFILNSIGLFLDGGGSDEYRSNPGPGFQMLRQPIFDAGRQPSCSANPLVPNPVQVAATTPSLATPRELVCQDLDPADASPIQDMDDVIAILNGALATPGDEFQREFPNSTSSDLQNERDNTVWRQESVPGTAPGVVNAQQEAGPDGIVGAYNRRITGAQSTGLLLTPGGIGADVAAYDRYAAAVEQALDQFVRIELRIDDEAFSEAPPPTVEGKTKLSVEVDASILSDLVDLRSVEYSAANDQGTSLLGVVRARDCAEFCFYWETDDDLWPDGPYEIQARAYFSPKALAFSVGSVNATGNLVVDNPSRIEPFPFSDAVQGVKPAAFSPNPIAFGPHQRPGQASISFLVSRHSDGSAGVLRTEIVDPTAPTAPPVALIPGTTLAEGTKYRWQGTWNGRSSAGLSVTSGTYGVRFTALDDAARPERVREYVIEIQVEADRPGVTCARPLRLPQLDCNGSGIIPAIAATSRVGEFANIPVRWLPDTQVRALSDIAVYHVFTCTPGATPCPDNGWDYEPVPGTSLTFTVATVKSGENAFVAILAEDVFGNLEGAHPGDTTLQQAFQRKLAAGGALEMLLDLDAPRVQSEVVLRGQVLSVPFISANTDGIIRATANDTLSTVHATLFLVNAEGNSLEVHLSSAGEPPQDTVFTSTNFQNLEELESWPGGLVLYFLTVRDEAGNEAQVQGTLLLDPDAPTIGAESRVTYPEGKTFAANGDAMEPIIIVSDPPTFPNTIGSRPEDLEVTIDAHELNPNLGSYVLPKFRRTALSTFFTGTIDVTIEPTSPRIVSLPITVTDETGNVANGEIEVVFGQPTFGIAEPEVIEATHETLRIRWNTTQPSLGELRYGLSPRVENIAFEPSDTPSNDHEVELVGLVGQSNYFFRVIARDGQGLEELGPLRTARTPSGLNHTLAEPSDETNVFNASFVVRWETQLPSSPTSEIVYEVKIRPVDSSTFVSLARLDSFPGVHEFVLDPTEFTDGAYEVNVTARTPSETTHAVSPPFLIDRLRPQIIPELPTAGGTIVDASSSVQARILDAVSGVEPTSVRIALNGGPEIIAPYDPATQRAAVELPSDLAAGPNIVTIKATDKAGNTGATSWHFTFDQEGPVVQKATGSPPSGQAAVKRGDSIHVSAVVEDASEIQRVWVEAENLTSVAAVELDRHGEEYQGTFLADNPAFQANPAGLARLAVWAQDEHGFTSLEPGLIDLRTDDVPPRLLDVSVDQSLPDTMELLIRASEPARVLLQAPGVRFDPLQTREDESVTTATVHFVGRPLPVISVRMTLIDEAGHETLIERGIRTMIALDNTPPSSPEQLTAMATADGHVRLQWDPSPDDTGVSHYSIFRLFGGRGFLPVGTTEDPMFVDTPTNTPRTSYVVRAVDLAGHVSDPSEPVELALRSSPSLGKPAVTPLIGTSNTTFVFRVTYRDPTGQDPEWIRILLDDVPNAMQKETAADCSAGCEYWFRTTLPSITARGGSPAYRFEAKAGDSVVRFPAAGPAPPGPIVLETLPHPSDSMGGGAPWHTTPPVSSLLFVTFVMLLVGIRARRRKK